MRYELSNCTMDNNVTSRFIECFNLLKRDKVVSSGRQFCMSIGIYPQSWSKIIKGERSVTIEMIRKSAIIYKFNTNYLFLGVGDKVIKNCDGNKQSSFNPNVLEDKIFHVPVKAKAGYGDQFNDPVYLSDLDAYSLPVDYFKFGTYRSFEIEGDSMFPALNSGEIVICNKVEDVSLWQYNIKNGYVYVVVTKDDILVKRVINRIKDNHSLELISENKFYEPIILNIEEVQEIWLVKMKLSVFAHSGVGYDKELMNNYLDLNDTVKSQHKELVDMRDMISKLLKKNRDVS